MVIGYRVMKGLPMNRPREATMHRRDVFRAVTTMGVVAVATAGPVRSAAAATDGSRGKRRSQYQPNSAEVQAFYRVNSYPVK
jgi:hypothetical protein